MRAAAGQMTAIAAVTLAIRTAPLLSLLWICTPIGVRASDDPEPDGFGQCEVQIDPAVTKWSAAAVRAANAWANWFILGGNRAYLIQPLGTRPDKDIHFKDSGAVGTAAGVVSETRVSGSNTVIEALVQLNGTGTFTYYDDDTIGNCTGSGVHVETVFKHEIGHSLGLMHADVTGSNLMTEYETSPCVQREVWSDDYSIAIVRMVENGKPYFCGPLSVDDETHGGDEDPELGSRSRAIVNVQPMVGRDGRQRLGVACASGVDFAQGRIGLYSSRGRLVMRSPEFTVAQGQGASFDVDESVAPGVYFARFENGARSVAAGKVLWIK